MECFGRKDAPVLLYVHGGPGVGSYDFELFQKDLLSKELHLITFDQRGALRSNPLLEDENFSLRDLVEDCESLREAMGIKRWSVLGHSFGGYIALLYSNAYPQSVESLLFESPTFDLSLTARSLIRGAAMEFIKQGDEEQASFCNRTAEEDHTPEELFRLCFNHILNELGDKRENLYTYGPDKLYFDRVVSEAPFPKEYWSKQSLFQKKLFSEGAIYQSIMHLLCNVECPALLIKGLHDLVTCDIHVDSFKRDVKHGHLKIFENSGHSPRYEEPELYANTVISFILKSV